MSAVAPALLLRFLDAVIALLVAELVGLTVYRVVTGRGMRAAEATAFLGAGLTMVVAMRVTVADGPVAWFVAAMGASLVLHVWHVAQRWRRGRVSGLGRLRVGRDVGEERRAARREQGEGEPSA